MVEENKDNLLPEGQGYEELALEEEEREVEIPEEEVGGIQTLTDRQVLAPNLSDMQVAMLKLFPESFWIKAKRLHDLVMVGRIAPDVFMALLKIMVKSMVRRSNPKKPIDVGEMVTGVYAILSIGLDGKGRIDVLELQGLQRESEEIKALGAGGTFT